MRWLFSFIQFLANPAEISKPENKNMKTPLNMQSPLNTSNKIHITILIGEPSQSPTHWELEEF